MVKAKKKLVEQIDELVLKGGVSGIIGFGDHFGLKDEDKWTYNFSGVPVLDTEHKTADGPRWVSRFYHGTSPDPDDGGPWPNNVEFEEVLGPYFIVVEEKDVGQKSITVYAIHEDTRDRYFPVESVELVSNDYAEALQKDLSRFREIVEQANNGAMHGFEVGDYVIAGYQKMVIVGQLTADMQLQPVNVLQIENYPGAKYESYLPETIKDFVLNPVPVSGFGVK